MFQCFCVWLNTKHNIRSNLPLWNFVYQILIGKYQFIIIMLCYSTMYKQHIININITSNEIEMKGWSKIFVRPHNIKTIKTLAVTSTCFVFINCVSKRNTIFKMNMHVCMCVYMCVYMYVCVYICMYVRMYVCMYVCMYSMLGQRGYSQIGWIFQSLNCPYP